jgi:hypothetical protein
MRFAGLILVFAALDVPGTAQVDRLRLQPLLDFETQVLPGPPRGWYSSAGFVADDQTVHGGKWAARIDRTASTPDQFSTITLSVPSDFEGDSVEVHAYIKTENVSQFFALWIREDGETPGVAFNSLEPRQLHGTNEWKEYSIAIPHNSNAKQLFFGALIRGTGKMWVDDVRVLVDGKPIWDAPAKKARADDLRSRS